MTRTTTKENTIRFRLDAQIAGGLDTYIVTAEVEKIDNEPTPTGPREVYVCEAISPFNLRGRWFRVPVGIFGVRLNTAYSPICT